MKKVIMILISIMLFAGTSVYAQESIEQYLMKLTQPGVEDYVKLLYEGSHENKVLAATKLRELGVKNQDVIDALIFGLQQGTVFVQRVNGRVINDFWDVRTASALALGELGGPKVLPYLYQAGRYEPDTYVKSAIAVAMGKIGQKEAIPEIKRMILTADRSGNDDVLLLACIQALRDIGDKDAFIPLVEIARGKYTRSVRVAAIEALKKVKW